MLWERGIKSRAISLTGLVRRYRKKLVKGYNPILYPHYLLSPLYHWYTTTCTYFYHNYYYYYY